MQGKPCTPYPIMKQRNILNRPVGVFVTLLLLIVSAAVANAQHITRPSQAVEPVSRSPPTPTNVSSAYPPPAYPAPATSTPQTYPYPPPVANTPPAYPYPPPVTNTPSNNLSIPLESGWNLVNIQSTGSDISQLLGSIAGHYDLVYAYDACDVADSWKKYDTNAPPFANDLTHIDVGAGLWIHMTAADTLELNQRAANPTTIPLCRGWNLVGYPSTQPLPVADALASIDGAYELVYSYNATDTDDPWQKYDPKAPPFANDLTEMGAGQAYWIKVKQEMDWTIR